ncbi:MULTISPECIES: Sec-independent protein translocase protein TatB [Novosphingopyxis]|uniref:Sec-independent protein translocase protein TatB n=1 Tax=Novosphingopyxis TaxID=2709686 RepID=UPI0016511993|nr:MULTISPECIES: Sec-independent protein translocase protein TatB [Novosphingopyxis]MBH9537603.1 twin-arginine translocase subunit TatB [Novosphingopyxis sp. YJ-S2-01]|tara:strand:- start:449 stop:832 length:384 start_codon:yes stop_codon:yes gene_type:complete
MFDLGISEMAVIAVIAIVAIGPKQLPDALMTAGRWVARIRGVMRQVREGFDEMVREAELKDLEKKWADENARIMREHPEGALTPEQQRGDEPQMRPLPPPEAPAATFPPPDESAPAPAEPDRKDDSA